MIYITRKEHFNAAHKLYNSNFSHEKNLELYGTCSNENWHGHNYDLIVTVKGNINSETGMFINLKTLSDIIKLEILEKVDHKNLNLDVPFLEGKVTTTENVVIEFWKILDKKLRLLNDVNCQLHCIKLYETPRNFVEYYGEK